MIDYEYMILDIAEDDGGVADDCASCPHKGMDCQSQCEKETEIYNPNLY